MWRGPDDHQSNRTTWEILLAFFESWDIVQRRTPIPRCADGTRASQSCHWDGADTKPLFAIRPRFLSRPADKRPPVRSPTNQPFDPLTQLGSGQFGSNSHRFLPICPANKPFKINGLQVHCYLDTVEVAASVATAVGILKAGST